MNFYTAFTCFPSSSIRSQYEDVVPPDKSALCRCFCRKKVDNFNNSVCHNITFCDFCDIFSLKTCVRSKWWIFSQESDLKWSVSPKIFRFYSNKIQWSGCESFRWLYKDVFERVRWKVNAVRFYCVVSVTEFLVLLVCPL